MKALINGQLKKFYHLFMDFGMENGINGSIYSIQTFQYGCNGCNAVPHISLERPFTRAAPLFLHSDATKKEGHINTRCSFMSFKLSCAETTMHARWGWILHLLKRHIVS